MEQVYDFIANTTDGACVVDREQRIVLWNDGARRLLGFRADSVVGRHCYDVLGGTDESGCAVCHRGCLATRAARRGELVPTRMLSVETSSGDASSVSVTTLLLPSRWRHISVLAHLFRPAPLEAVLPEDFRRGWLARAPALGDRPPASSGALTGREREVLRLLSSGATTEGMMSRLGIARTTVRTHIRHVLEKLGVHSRLEAVALGLSHLACEDGTNEADGSSFPPVGA